ncbi:cysteine synthase [Streptomyces achromogenes]|uniref:pyridoxal-phosphate dependent enzyme n=1 Tax=Streptomyces achromogenes TaxID=67255 RepID=UPI00278BAACE|nr:cysteine synthase [Streptomyces achromogenes]
MPQQFRNPANPDAHRRTTAQEIWHDTAGQVDILVAGVGTGGTVTGVGQLLKEKKPEVTVVAVEPAESAVLSGGRPRPAPYPGPRRRLRPGTSSTPRSTTPCSASPHPRPAPRLAAWPAPEGILTGVSGGAALHAASTLAHYPQHKGALTVVVLPDTGERYLSTDLFHDQ